MKEVLDFINIEDILLTGNFSVLILDESLKLEYIPLRCEKASNSMYLNQYNQFLDDLRPYRDNILKICSNIN